ncbi:hypothetical protein [Roseomonas chloroacetimidivorans]|uniref:hypothetical protein n=1 Tax=Roseomonas chloroacetimidivorans TaxID=1766656 RepID=UPI003C744C24
MRDSTGNLPLSPAVYPDYPGPIVRTAADGVRELATARWGLPSPAFALKDRKTAPLPCAADGLQQEGEVTTLLDAFLMAEPNAVV